MNIKNPVFYLDVHTYQGVSIGAIHYYGKMKLSDYCSEESIIPPCGVDFKIELYFKMSARDAKSLNKHDNYRTYKAGNYSSRYETKEQLIEQSINIMKVHFSNGLLIKGDNTYCEAFPVIYYPPTFDKAAARMNELSKMAKADKNWKEWDDLLKKFKKS